MGLFWDLWQQSQISSQESRTQSLSRRVSELERELRRTQRLLHDLIGVLEERFGRDIDGDGRIG
jgi:hypothetical protein